MCYVYKYKINYENFIASFSQCLMRLVNVASQALAISVQSSLKQSMTGDNGQSYFKLYLNQMIVVDKTNNNDFLPTCIHRWSNYKREK